MAATAAMVAISAASAMDQRQQAKKAANKAEDEAEAAKKAEIAKGMREAQMKNKQQRAYAAGTQSLLTGSGVSSAGLMG
jgi:hypothetical protein